MTDVKVYIAPNFRGVDNGDGGIRRVVEAQKRYLPDYGVQIVSLPDQADILALHAGVWVNSDKPTVSHCHGLYWDEYDWANWAHDLNDQVINALRLADHVTAPSEWVAQALRRGMWLNPTVLYHGIEPELWEPGENLGYVLWNKTRVDQVCDPAPLDELAIRAPDIKFVTTYGRQVANVHVTGTLPFEEARELIRNAGVYLCTTRETMGIGTLEAMASGVPILGWRWGGQAEFIVHKETGWLCNPGDYDGLREGLDYCLTNRDRLGQAARSLALSRFSWHDVMADYVSTYERVIDEFHAPRPKVSVIIPCYNLAATLPDAVHSALAQNIEDIEVIIVSDNSPDNTSDVAVMLMTEDNRVSYIKNEENLYLAGTLNVGIKAARGKYIVPLDADNMLGDHALKILTEAMDKDRTVDIAYGSMELIEPDGKVWTSGWPTNEFNFRYQMSHRNQIPSTSMYRRRVWERVGGYRRRCRTAEDADFWCRTTSFGFQPKKVTEAVTLRYRNRPDSMSHVQSDWGWNDWYPWSRNLDLTPFGASVEGRKKVPSYEPVSISVIIPVGPDHTELVVDAIDSLVAQTFTRWEAIVINDSGKEIPWLPTFARQFTTTPEGGMGPAIARNLGIQAAKGRLILCLDADDYLHPSALQKMFDVQSSYGGYVYSDWFVQETMQKVESPDFNCKDLLGKLTHAVTFLFPKKSWEEIGGFDATLDAWEDWDFVLSLVNSGCCGTRIPQPLFYYRLQTGVRREGFFADIEAKKQVMYDKWGEYISGGKELGCSSCGGGGGHTIAWSGQSAQQQSNFALPEGDMVLLEFQGTGGAQTFIGKVTGTKYRFGSDPGHKTMYVHREDSGFLLSLVNRFQEVKKSEIETEPVLAASGPPNGY